MKKQRVKEKNCSYKAWYFAELTVVWLQCDHTFTCTLYVKRKQIFSCSRGRAQSNTWPVMWTDSQTDYPRLRNWFSLLWWSFTCRTCVFDLGMVIIIWWVDLPTWLHLLEKASILCSSWLLKSSWDLSSVTASLSLVKIDASHELVMWCHSLAESMI